MDYKIRRWLCVSSILLLTLFTAALAQYTPTNAQSGFVLQFSDEFNGAANTGVNTSNWLYDTGTCYPGCPAANWGTGEVESMSSSTANVFQDGAGHLVIKPIKNGSA